jgi:hypothetical protein
MSSGYELKEDGRTTGPHSLVVLRQKAEIHVLRPDHLVRLASASEPGPWLPIREIPELHALLFPPRAVPRLASSVSFEPANARVDAEQPATDVFKLLKDNAARQRAAEDELLKDLGPRPNNRRRDYLVLAISLNGFVAAVGSFVGYHNPFLIGLWTMGNLGLVWVLYFVMDRY